MKSSIKKDSVGINRRSKEVRLIEDTVCACVCTCMRVRYVRTDVRCTCGCVCVCEKEGEKDRREGPKGMEKPIPSYQRKWLLVDRKERHAFSAEDDNNKRLRSRSKLMRESLFIIGPYIPHDISISFFHVHGLWIILAHFRRSQTRAGIICCAGDEFFRNF